MGKMFKSSTSCKNKYFSFYLDFILKITSQSQTKRFDSRGYTSEVDKSTRRELKAKENFGIFSGCWKTYWIKSSNEAVNS